MGHPLFARAFVLVSRLARGEVAPHRDEALAPAAGRVIEVGAGHGENFARYPAAVTEVVAVEPEPYLRGRALAAAAVAPVPVRVVDGHAGALPDGPFDTAVASLVLRPGGQLLFYEHVVAEDPRLARRQARLDPLWSRVAGGCHANRDTVAAIEAAGFEIERLRRFDLPRGGIVKPHVIGVAR
jgi:SAM-dependent methyltransferase